MAYLGYVSAALIATGVVIPLGLDIARVTNFAGYVTWCAWLVAMAIVLLRNNHHTAAAGPRLGHDLGCKVGVKASASRASRLIADDRAAVSGSGKSPPIPLPGTRESSGLPGRSRWMRTVARICGRTASRPWARAGQSHEGAQLHHEGTAAGQQAS
jgi:hypothetical protein